MMRISELTEKLERLKEQRYLSRYFKKIYEELFAPLKVSAGALPLRFATPGYFSNVNRLISV